MTQKHTQQTQPDPAPGSGLQAMAYIHTELRLGHRAKVLSAQIADLLPQSAATVLDVGAGNAKLARAILDRRPDLTIDGIDTKIWPERLIQVEQFDGNTIPYEDDTYDVCLVSDVLHHCSNAVELLAEMTRVTRRYILIKDHVANTAFDFQTLKFMDWLGNRSHVVTLPYNYWSWKQWQDTFASLGLDIETLRTKLRLYPQPLSLIFDRNLHFIALLKVTK